MDYQNLTGKMLCFLVVLLLSFLVQKKFWTIILDNNGNVVFTLFVYLLTVEKLEMKF